MHGPGSGTFRAAKKSRQHYPTIPRENSRNVHGAFIIIFKGTVTQVALMYAVKEIEGYTVHYTHMRTVGCFIGDVGKLVQVLFCRKIRQDENLYVLLKESKNCKRIALISARRSCYFPKNCFKCIYLSVKYRTFFNARSKKGRISYLPVRIE
jgi:hypothetical protein